MENLHTLHIEDDMISPGLVTWSCLPIIGRSRLPSLKPLSLTGDAYAYSHEFASDLFFFIQNHTLLEHLQLPHGYGNLPFLPTDIPYLKSLVATTEDARKIVWGRRITSLELQDMPCHSFEEVWSDLRGSTNALRRVSLVASSEPSLLASNLNAMARHLDQLATLSLTGLSHTSYNDVSGCVPSFARLRYLVVHVSYPDIVPEMDAWDNLKLQCPDLISFRIIRQGSS
ncbi:hypothetical protein FRB94_011033 [Tulasnella sp. JGI-2019a]|nr:hypothetical protein FRB94_011033 [Tulasnella sp. JGI-2019a]